MRLSVYIPAPVGRGLVALARNRLDREDDDTGLQNGVAASDHHP